MNYCSSCGTSYYGNFHQCPGWRPIFQPIQPAVTHTLSPWIDNLALQRIAAALEGIAASLAARPG